MSIWDRFFSKKTADTQIPVPRRGFGYSGGTLVYDESAMQVSAYYRGVVYISTQIAKLPWDVKDKNNNVQDSAISNLLSLAPNPEMNAMTFRLLAVQTAINYGNFYAEIERNMLGTPIAIWPIPTNWVTVKRTEQGELVYQVSNSGLGDSETVYLAKEDVFHIKNFHTKDGITGQGLIAYARDILGISLGADTMANSLFANGGLPSGVLEHPGKLSDAAYARIKESWKHNYGGRKSGGVAILEEGLKFNALSMSPDILQFLESRQFNVLEIARFLGLPPTKLFDVKAATFNNQENSNLEVATDTLDAWAKNFEMEADIKILNKRFGGRYSEMDLYAVFRGDMDTRANYFSKMMQTASLTPNEIREKEGLAPYAGGDRYYVAVNNYSPADRIDEIVDSQISKGDSATTAKPVDANISAELEQEAIRFLKGR